MSSSTQFNSTFATAVPIVPMEVPAYANKEFLQTTPSDPDHLTDRKLSQL
eukprot:CAMPEP_0202457954 /NCGR_PEP_ID=MMETSP1360-20130828/18372_1 /ASSEMBLY_ACC=CAM_ASM_000848 /TAXON_ID=515479 /ORGANISM="Licmophora paradoxa, Strain CCMP2313" /LENGTH=49 /DNA_ID= /DNA_START= /DNA_END= /DNA_ORIENTATION=